MLSRSHLTLSLTPYYTPTTTTQPKPPPHPTPNPSPPTQTHTRERALFTPALLGYVVKPTGLTHKVRGRNCCVLEGSQANKYRNQDKGGGANPYPCTVF